MILLQITNPTPTSLAATNSLNPDPHLTRTVALTTPTNYASRLIPLIQTCNWVPLWCPTIIVDPTSTTLSTHLHHLFNDNFSAIAFTSRAAISAVDSALSAASSPPLSGELIVSALGKDSDLLVSGFLAKLSSDPARVRVLVPPTPTPAGLVDSLGPGSGRRVLCPVPRVVDLTEPPVVPNFLRDLESMGWVPVRAEAYETRWAGPKCVEPLGEAQHLDGVIITSTAEVEGLLKGLNEIGLSWEEVKKKWPKLIVAAHGPVTACGSESLGVKVDVVSRKFSSFDGVVEALEQAWRNLGY